MQSRTTTDAYVVLRVAVPPWYSQVTDQSIDVSFLARENHSARVVLGTREKIKVSMIVQYEVYQIMIFLTYFENRVEN